jgi:hypothetical protein
MEAYNSVILDSERNPEPDEDPKLILDPDPVKLTISDPSGSGLHSSVESL